VTSPVTSRDEPGSYRDADGYADLASYAAIGDGRTVALIALDGRIDWLPVPSLVSAIPFAAVLDAGRGGCVETAPVEPFTTERAYVEGTNVLVTTFTTASGVVRLTDSLNTGVAGRLPWTELARRIEGVSGSVRMRAVARPGTCLNAASPWIQETVHGLVLRVDGLTMGVVASDDADLVHDPSQVAAEFVTEPGSTHVFGLVGTEREPVLLPDADDLLAGVERTIRNWTQWSDAIDPALDLGSHSDAVRRSALALKLLIHAPSGAIAAAATTSLPESRSGGKNWDYRYAWVRDMAYTMTALLRFGLKEETHAAISWLLSTIRENGPEPEILYGLDGSVHSGGASEADAPGWRGIGPVLWGNGAADQLQLGVYGDLFSIVGLYVRDGNIIDADTGRMLAQIADLTCDTWRRKDAGMWELETQQHYTSSKMACWQALREAVTLAEMGQIPGDPERWRNEAERIRAWVDEHGWSEERQAYVWHPGTDQLDASVLLHAVSGFDRGPRMSSTLDALDRELGIGPHLFRYSGVAEEESTFVACSFWMVSALALVGRTDEARERFDALMVVPNDVGIMCELYDPVTGDALGNLPQALSHLALINAAITVEDHCGRVAQPG